MSSYETIAPIAEGGMGVVELVVRRERTFRRAYARKRLKPTLREDVTARAMFAEEARVAGLVHHPNVVAVLDVGEDEAGPFLVMDYVPGLSLSELLRELSQRGEHMPLQLAYRVFVEVARALDAAHRLEDHAGRALGLVHRDVSPQNILLGYDGRARLTDFGIAKVNAGLQRTSTGVLKGKLRYLAPEQLRFAQATRQTDLFSMGVSLMETILGRNMYESRVPEEVARAIVEAPPPDPLDTREDIEPNAVALLAKLLAKAPSKRPQDAAEVEHALEELLAERLQREGPITLRGFLEERFAKRAREQRAWLESAKTRALKRRRSRRTGYAVAALLGALSLGGLAVGASAWPQAETPSAILARAVHKPVVAAAAPTLPAPSETPEAADTPEAPEAPDEPARAPTGEPTVEPRVEAARRSSRRRARRTPTAAEPPGPRDERPRDELWNEFDVRDEGGAR